MNKFVMITELQAFTLAFFQHWNRIFMWYKMMVLCTLHFSLYFVQVIRNKFSREHSSFRESEQKAISLIERTHSDNQRYFNMVFHETLALVKYRKI